MGVRTTATLLACLAVACNDEPSSNLTVATFNTWGAGLNNGQPIAHTVAVMNAIDADVFTLQEVRAESPECADQICPPAGPSVADDLAQALGYYVYEQSGTNDALWANAILSRYPILSALPEDLGVLIDVDGRRIAVLNAHLPDYPYQPYQVVGIEYGDAPMLRDEMSAIDAALDARGAAVNLLLEVIGRVKGADLIVVCGDFNEPSHLDWTDRAVQAGRHPMKVRFPASTKLSETGFVDAYRDVWRDEVAFPGFTWTPTAPIDDRNEHHDRIDFIYLKDTDLRVMSASVVGESLATSDIVVEPWQSDHRAVFVRTQF